VNAIDADPEVPDEIPPRVPRGAGGLHVAGAAEFLAEEIAEPRWLALDIVPEHGIGVIGGAPKVLKLSLIHI